ncbi:hypothetical protein CCACVL1_07514 [Corchorus capsularis]|uniref:Uncharacterized protein n=1 Tax=Corchorus capsularis TaxID=210143 RepID=A0A1R3J5N4_COCAP|nr:hypothetical protein CCACVL1_07514 [Corchorus capsularis]
MTHEHNCGRDLAVSPSTLHVVQVSDAAHA